ncbi:hypothetical protein Belba_1554 [Belliella baltica DSM 15883]|uniref:Uncharacterized protein n=1 Tax=Belliella baltica (strain DSM 15883 / CIP 108006 / LMG 21964 / BA134) TaxID=866536 RepID=I3Z4J8_BELBD|nr:hypothetical protein [Belliella baltica]AFL84166.1 hypothetical protein Belba_1554 [Belliella baltica DSM 15883]
MEEERGVDVGRLGKLEDWKVGKARFWERIEDWKNLSDVAD